MSSTQKRTYLLLVLILLTGLTDRLIGLISRPIWYDEAFSLLISREGPAGVLKATLSKATSTASADIHPPAYYFLLWGWSQLFGSNIVSARLLSILISLGGLLLVFWLARKLFDDETALLATLAAALLPFQVHYGVEMRMYGLLAAFLSLATLAFWKGIKTRRVTWWLTFAVAAALAMYTHNLAAFYLLPLAATALFLHDWKIIRNTFLAGLGAVLLYLPWLVQIPAQFSKVQQNYWVERPTFTSLVNLLLVYIPNLPLPAAWLLPGLLLAVFLIFLAFFQTYLAFRKKTPHYKTGLWLLYLSFAPPALLWLYSQWLPVYIERALLPSHVMFCIWLAWTLSRTPMPKIMRGFALTLFLIGCMMGLVEHQMYAGFPYGPFDVMDQTLADRIQPGDVIIHSNKLTYLPAFYFDKTLPQVFIIDEPGSKSDTLLPATRAVLRVREAVDTQTAAGAAQKIWFVIFQKEIEDDKASNGSEPVTLQYLNGNYKLVTEETWGEVLLYQFVK